jgi:hypothetical protein
MNLSSLGVSLFDGVSPVFFSVSTVEYGVGGDVILKLLDALPKLISIAEAVVLRDSVKLLL